MEAFVTRKEFESVLKELRRLQLFLAETFGNKFTEFQSKGKGEDAEDGLNPQLGVVAETRRTISTSTSHESVMFSGRPRVDSVSFGIGVDRSRKGISNTDGVVVLDPLKIADVEPSTPIVTSTRSLFHDKTLPLSGPTRGISISGVQTSPILPVLSLEPRSPSSAVFVGAKPAKAKPNKIRLKKLNGGPSGALKAHQPTPIPSKKTKVNSPLVPSNVDTENGIPFKRIRWNLSTRKRKEPLGSGETKRTSSSLSLQPSASVSEIIQCDHCQLFIYSSELEAHMKNHSVFDAKNRKQPDNNLIFMQPQTCPKCLLKCVDFQAYEDHFQKHHASNEIPCPICGQMHLTVQLRSHMSTHKNQRFTCEVCGKSYSRKDNLTAHFSKAHRTAEEPTIFYCGFCRKTAFASMEGRDRHMKTAHFYHSDSSSPSSGKLASITKSGTTETISCGNGTANLTGFVYEGEDEDDIIHLD